ncbi:MAG: 16S rRNA (adenine(1518)-N(6)/adenine(1519)-N(6))-dimethyltransferase RsmA [Elusimicrobiota bacterium]
MRQPFGQNFLSDKRIALRILAAAGITPTDTVIEIGPGKGILTDLLAPAAARLVAVEIDRDLAGTLNRRFVHAPQVAILNADFLQLDNTALGDCSDPVYVSNLPYNVSTAIIEKILTAGRWKSAVFMVQKEVADRITAAHGTSAYGAYSVFCQYFADIELLFKVPPSCFLPPPKVDSAVIRFTNKHAPEPDKHLFPVVRYCFQHKRKMIANSLERSTGIAKEEILRCLEIAGIPPTSRAQQLPLECFLSLTKILEICTITSDGNQTKK